MLMVPWMKIIKLVEVQFQSADRHLQQGTLCTVVSASHCGGSYLNEVELQNGCLAIDHSKLIIRSCSFPSTIQSSKMDADGKLSEEMLEKSRKTVCFGTQNLLVKGAKRSVSNMYQQRTTTFLPIFSYQRPKTPLSGSCNKRSY